MHISRRSSFNCDRPSWSYFHWSIEREILRGSEINRNLRGRKVRSGDQLRWKKRGPALSLLNFRLAFEFCDFFIAFFACCVLLFYSLFLDKLSFECLGCFDSFGYELVKFAVVNQFRWHFWGSSVHIVVLDQVLFVLLQKILARKKFLLVANGRLGLNIHNHFLSLACLWLIVARVNDINFPP